MLILCFTHAILGALILPAVKGAHYLLVPHPAEQFVRPVGTGSERRLRVDPEGLAASLGAGDPQRPPPEFVSQNQTSRVRKLVERFRAERELAEEVVRHGRATGAEGKKQTR